ncbi:hypothetical protein LCGC14_1599690 [marine sediment metagenome]|uniref:Nuclease associated modular domain-containing protein n=1 Tax=marine sediment metagenome TaxID=412755 RepID=A0A0F9IBH8_9ZZZZ
MYLYIATFPNDKKYIGITNNFKARKRKHRFLAKRGNVGYFYNAIRKYGWGNIKWNVSDGYNSWDDLCSAEITEIEMYNTHCYNFDSNGYNMTKGGDGTIGFTHSKKYKERLSKKWIGKNNPNYGKKLSTKQKLCMKKGRENRVLSQKEIDKQKANIPKGEKHHSAKLTQQKVNNIRKKYKNGGYTYRKLAQEYGVSETTVSRIVRGILWAN